MGKNILYIFIMTALIGCSATHNPIQEGVRSKMEITNKEKAIAFIQAFATGNPDVLEFVDVDKFISHNPYLPPGKETLLAAFPGEPSGATIKTIRAYTDGDFVILHNHYRDVAGYPPSIITFDLFRFESGKIVEHWDNIATETIENPSGHTQLDGPVEATNLDKTAENKALVEEYVHNVFINGKFEKLGNYLNGEEFIQHNTMMSDGISGVKAFLAQMKKDGIELEFSKIHHVLGEGNFALVVFEGQVAHRPTSFYDLFRIDNGKIVEEWDVIEEILPQDKWTHENGKY